MNSHHVPIPSVINSTQFQSNSIQESIQSLTNNEEKSLGRTRDGTDEDSDEECVNVTEIYLNVITETLKKTKLEFELQNMDDSKALSALNELELKWKSGLLQAVQLNASASKKNKNSLQTKQDQKNTKQVIKSGKFSSGNGQKISRLMETAKDDAKFRESIQMQHISNVFGSEYFWNSTPASDIGAIPQRVTVGTPARLLSGTMGGGVNREEIPQSDGAGGGGSPDRKKIKVESGGVENDGDEDDEPPLNSDDDDDLDDGEDAVGEEPETDNLILAQYEKVTKKQGKWKVQLKDGIAIVNRRDYLFSRAVCELQW